MCRLFPAKRGRAVDDGPSTKRRATTVSVPRLLVAFFRRRTSPNPVAGNAASKVPTKKEQAERFSDDRATEAWTRSGGDPDRALRCLADACLLSSLYHPGERVDVKQLNISWDAFRRLGVIMTSHSVNLRSALQGRISL